MILVVPDLGRPAQAFTEALGRPAVEVTAEDLTTPGWCFDPARPARSVVVAGGAPLAVAGLDAVVCALPLVPAQLLTAVRAQDRAYAAAELTALLTAVIATAPCPVLNPPRDGCLCGPGWSPEQWAALARQAGVPVWPLHRDTRPSAAPGAGEGGGDDEWVGVCGEQVTTPDADPVLAGHARALATTSRVPVLALGFRRRRGVARLTAVHPWPDLSDPGLPAAVVRHLDAA